MPRRKCSSSTSQSRAITWPSSTGNQGGTYSTRTFVRGHPPTRPAQALSLYHLANRLPSRRSHRQGQPGVPRRHHPQDAALQGDQAQGRRDARQAPGRQAGRRPRRRGGPAQRQEAEEHQRLRRPRRGQEARGRGAGAGRRGRRGRAHDRLDAGMCPQRFADLLILGCGPSFAQLPYS